MRAKRLTRMIAGLVLMVLALVGFGYVGVNTWIHQSRVDAAKQLSASPVATPTVTVATPTPSVSATVPPVTPSPTTTITTPAPTSVAPVPAPLPPAIVYPIQGFSWQEAGVNVTVVPMDQMTWQQQASASGIDPPLDANGFDRVGHWLEGTGPGLNGPTHAIILAAHTCFSEDATLCNDTTFPFRRLSFGGWAAGQQAAITDAAGHSFDLTLVRRELVLKSGFRLDADQDACEVQVFSCTQGDAHTTATLVTFRRTQCAA